MSETNAVCLCLFFSFFKLLPPLPLIKGRVKGQLRIGGVLHVWYEFHEGFLKYGLLKQCTLYVYWQNCVFEALPRDLKLVQTYFIFITSVPYEATPCAQGRHLVLHGEACLCHCDRAFHRAAGRLHVVHGCFFFVCFKRRFLNRPDTDDTQMI